MITDFYAITMHLKGTYTAHACNLAAWNILLR